MSDVFLHNHVAKSQLLCHYASATVAVFARLLAALAGVTQIEVILLIGSYCPRLAKQV
jgi:hypothetical protein